MAISKLVLPLILLMAACRLYPNCRPLLKAPLPLRLLLLPLLTLLFPKISMILWISPLYYLDLYCLSFSKLVLSPLYLRGSLPFLIIQWIAGHPRQILCPLTPFCSWESYQVKLGPRLLNQLCP